MNPGLVQERIVCHPDDHVHIMVRAEGKPNISLDISNYSGRRTISVRVNGMNIGNHLIDVEELPASHDSEVLARFCPYCGEKINMLSSLKKHECRTG